LAADCEEASCDGVSDTGASGALGWKLLSDCRPSGVGDVMDGVTCSGATGLSPASAGSVVAGTGTGAGPVTFAAAGDGGVVLLSSSDIASLNVPSTITTTLAATSTDLAFEDKGEGSLSFAPAALLTARLPFSGGGAAAAACAARRAAAMKLDDDTGWRCAAGISLIASSDAAIRSDGEATRPFGRVPGSRG